MAVAPGLDPCCKAIDKETQFKSEVDFVTLARMFQILPGGQTGI